MTLSTVPSFSSTITPQPSCCYPHIHIHISSPSYHQFHVSSPKQTLTSLILHSSLPFTYQHYLSLYFSGCAFNLALKMKQELKMLQHLKMLLCTSLKKLLTIFSLSNGRIEMMQFLHFLTTSLGRRSIFKLKLTNTTSPTKNSLSQS